MYCESLLLSRQTHGLMTHSLLPVSIYQTYSWRVHHNVTDGCSPPPEQRTTLEKSVLRTVSHLSLIAKEDECDTVRSTLFANVTFVIIQGALPTRAGRLR